MMKGATLPYIVKVLIAIESLDPDAREIILWRSGFSMLHVNTSVCHHHNYVLSKRFSMQQKTCCNPFGLHSTIRKGKHSSSSSLYAFNRLGIVTKFSRSLRL